MILISPVSGRRAFTLVELLVVVAIIALLLAILLPALGKAKEQARRAVCLSNEHQFGTAFSVYANDHRSAIPASDYQRSNGAGKDHRWYQVLAGVAGSGEFTRCPSSTVSNKLKPSRTTPNDQTRPAYPHYASNGNHNLSGSQGQGYRAPMDPEGLDRTFPSTIPAGAPIDNGGKPVWAEFNKITQIPLPSELIFVAESGWDGGGSFNKLWTPSYSNPLRYEWAHPGGSMSFMFGDGHARHMQLTESIFPRNLWDIEQKPVSASFEVYLTEVEAMFRY